MIMFVVIKQSLVDQELSDTECVQVSCPACLVCLVVVVVVELKHKNFQDSPPCQVFSPGAGSAPTTVYQILGSLGSAPPPPLRSGDLQLCSSSYSSRYLSQTSPGS